MTNYLKEEKLFLFHNYCMKSLQQIVKILKKIKFYWLFNRRGRKALSSRSTPQRNFLYRLQKSFYNLLFFFKNLLHHTTHFACSVSLLYRQGRRGFHSCDVLPWAKLEAQKCTRMYILQPARMPVVQCLRVFCEAKTLEA